MYIHSAHSLLLTARDENESIDDELWAACGQKIRRIDRYIKMSLLGALRCVDGVELPGNTRLLLATNCGTASTSVPIFDAILNHNTQPKPFQFVNSLGNSACFFLARTLGLNGAAHVVSKGELSYEACLQHAFLHVNGGMPILLGGTDEAPLPIADQLVRVNARAEQTRCYEGSHWLLLSTERPERIPVEVSTPVFYYDIADVIQVLDKAKPDAVCVNDCKLAAQLNGMPVNAVPLADCVPHGTYSGNNFVLAYNYLLAGNYAPGHKVAILTIRRDVGMLACTFLSL